MNLGSKEELDALLQRWPATPPKDVTASGDEERGWDERAEAIVRAAVAAKADGTANGGGEDLFAAPSLVPEVGEGAAITAAGDKKMSQENESGDSSTSKSIPAPSQPKRQSLKEIAARASQSGARMSQPGAPPPSIPAPRLSTPTPLPRPVEASKEDSGVINLQVVQNTATAQQRAAAEKAKPAQAGLFEDEKPAESAAESTQIPPTLPVPEKPATVTALPAKKSNTGVIGGVAIAVLGIAAAFAIVSRKPDAAPPAAAAHVEKAPEPAKTAAPEPAAATATPTAVASAEPTPSASADSKADAPKAPVAVGGPLPSAPSTAAAAPSADAKVAAKTPTPTGKPGDLQSEMAKAVGQQDGAKADQGGPAPEPAAAGPKNQNIPEQPSQGAVAAAFGPVMGGAKSCVAGADDVSRASVTFSSSGAVTSVSVSGWAAANGKSGCVQAALKGAKVGPFSKPSFTVGVPIRP
ncbi:serine/threonine protein kinase [Minicystis rosea]|nr:serine/threonine protein kinase [Minicystis rosea]